VLPGTWGAVRTQNTPGTPPQQPTAAHAPAPACRRAAPGAYIYVSNTTNSTYILNTTKTDFKAAQRACNNQGGHLVSYSSAAEQVEVESYYVNLGVLFPKFHRTYWMGLQGNGSFFPAQWSWVNPTAGGTPYPPRWDAGFAPQLHLRCAGASSWLLLGYIICAEPLRC
jgi:hypothetical protein